MKSLIVVVSFLLTSVTLDEHHANKNKHEQVQNLLVNLATACIKKDFVLFEKQIHKKGLYLTESNQPLPLKSTMKWFCTPVRKGITTHISPFEQYSAVFRGHLIYIEGYKVLSIAWD